MVLNGIGGAMAGVLVPAMPGTAVIDGGMPESSTSGDCAGHAAPEADGGRVRPPAPDRHAGDEGRCGDSLQCLQACLHASMAVAPVFFLGVQPQQADAILHPLAGGHPAPPLPSPIRPPIA